MSDFNKFLDDSLKGDRPEDKDYEDGVAVPEEFALYSKVIVVSNEEDKPDYLEDTLSIRLDMGKDESIKELHSKLDSILNEYPEITLEDKLNVLSIYESNKKESGKITIEQFLKMCIIHKADLPNAEKWMLAQIKRS